MCTPPHKICWKVSSSLMQCSHIIKTSAFSHTNITVDVRNPMSVNFTSCYSYTGQFKKKVTLRLHGVAILQHGLPWRRLRPETLSRASITNFESFPNNSCISHDCSLTGYFIINIWKCYLLFELLFINKNLIKYWEKCVQNFGWKSWRE
jgi:hypothetical protein